MPVPYIVAVGGEGAIRRRLLDMGLTPGTEVTMLPPAPAGDPLAIRLRGFELTLRRADCANIEIDPSASNAKPNAASSL